MAETKVQEEPALLAKRKPDVSGEEGAEFPQKALKIETFDKENQNPQGNSSIAELKDRKDESAAEKGPEEDEDDEDEGYGDGEKSNGKAEADRKGKGIMRDDKGKGKMIVEDEDDDEEDSDDDSSDGGSELEGEDSDLSDDPLAEVDLDNILPSRTRRRQVQPGVYIANDLGNDGDSDSDDSDA
ncbi:hypothetical protein UlMin_013883 [Ulmus minor]